MYLIVIIIINIIIYVIIIIISYIIIIIIISNVLLENTIIHKPIVKNAVYICDEKHLLYRLYSLLPQIK